MYKRLLNYLGDVQDRQRIAIALAKGGAMRQARQVNLELPATWEFSGFSQNGEDGVIQVLLGQLKRSNRYFIEIGAADGIQNNTAWLAVAEQFNGIMVEGNPKLAATMLRLLNEYSIGTHYLNRFVTRENVRELVALADHRDPDLLSLDIDGNDYYIAQALLAHGLRPKIFVVEYNSVFGPQRALTVPYRDNFSFDAHPTQLYYGVSLAGWRKLLEQEGYRFVTVERNGVNAFFVDPAQFDAIFLAAVKGLPWAENRYQTVRHRMDSEAQFALLAGLPFESI